MNKLEVQAVVARAKRPIGDAISELSATTADAVRENPRAFVSVEGPPRSCGGRRCNWMGTGTRRPTPRPLTL